MSAWIFFSPGQAGRWLSCRCLSCRGLKSALWARRLAVVGALLLSQLLIGCTSTLVVQGSFPEPLVPDMPITAGVYYADEFRDYRYEETSKDRSRWIIDMGAAQTEMFNTVLPSMFTELNKLDQAPGENSLDASDSESGGSKQGKTQVDLIIAPQVAEFQYTLPSETRLKVFEIWIKYNVQVFRPDGGLIADWIVTAYGKTPTGFMRSNQAALNQAVVVALRDAGANLALNFGRVPEIRAWMEQR